MTDEEKKDPGLVLVWKNPDVDNLRKYLEAQYGAPPPNPRDAYDEMDDIPEIRAAMDIFEYPYMGQPADRNAVLRRASRWTVAYRCVRDVVWGAVDWAADRTWRNWR